MTSTSTSWALIALLAATYLTLLRELRIERRDILSALVDIKVTLARLDERLKHLEAKLS